MKKKLITFLVVFLLSASMSKVPAFSAESVSLSINNIKNIMIDNSIDMKIAENNLNNTKQNLDKVKDSIDDIDGEISSLNIRLNNALSERDTLIEAGEDTSDIDDEISDYRNKIRDKEQEQDKLYDNKKSAQRSLKTARLEYESKVEDAVYNAQKSYVNYLASIDQINFKNDNLKFKQKQTEAARIKYQYGFISKKEYNKLINDNIDYDYGITENQSSEEIILKNLKLTLGIDQNTDVSINDSIEGDMNTVLSIKYEDDLDVMLNKNIDLEISRMQLEWDEDDYEEEDDDDDYTNYSLENERLTLEKKIQSTEINFKEKYNSLMAAVNSLKSSYTQLKDKQTTLEVTIKKYQLGFASKNEVEKTKLDVDNEIISINKEKNEFYLKYLDYMHMKEGY